LYKNKHYINVQNINTFKCLVGSFHLPILVDHFIALSALVGELIVEKTQPVS